MPTGKSKREPATYVLFRRTAWSLAALLGLALLLSGCQAFWPALTSITVEWTTASEVDVVGFNLYRSESPDGLYTQVNPALIPGSNDPVTGGKYRYVDSNVAPGRTYYYKLEDVDLNGAKTMHGPIEVRAAGGGWPDSSLVVVILAGAGAAGIVGWYLRHH
jgi:hypothetical protein